MATANETQMVIPCLHFIPNALLAYTAFLDTELQDGFSASLWTEESRLRTPH